MKKSSVIVLLVVTFLFVFQSGDASSQQLPEASRLVNAEVPEGSSSQDELLALVSAQTKAIQSLATNIEELEAQVLELKARVLELENPGEE